MIPALVAILAIVLESWSSIWHSLDFFLKSQQLTVGAIITAMVPFFVIWNKISKEKEKRVRAAIVERRQLQIAFNVNEIMEKLGVESKWSLQEIGSSHEVHPSLKRLRLLSQAVIILRRKVIMDKLKSRKLWLAIFGALFPVLNVELGINLDPNVVFSVLAVIISGIAGLAHVDGKKAQAVVSALKTSVVVDPNATYRNLYPTIKEVHDRINKFLELAKTNDVNILAIYPSLNELLASYEHPIPVTVVEDKVAS